MAIFAAFTLTLAATPAEAAPLNREFLEVFEEWGYQPDHCSPTLQFQPEKWDRVERILRGDDRYASHFLLSMVFCLLTRPTIPHTTLHDRLVPLAEDLAPPSTDPPADEIENYRRQFRWMVRLRAADSSDEVLSIAAAALNAKDVDWLWAAQNVPDVLSDVRFPPAYPLLERERGRNPRENQRAVLLRGGLEKLRITHAFKVAASVETRNRYAHRRLDALARSPLTDEARLLIWWLMREVAIFNGTGAEPVLRRIWRDSPFDSSIREEAQDLLLDYGAITPSEVTIAPIVDYAWDFGPFDP